MGIKDGFLGRSVDGTRVIPLELKIVALFSVFLLVSNFASNYINLIWNRGELIKLQQQLLVKDVTETYGFAANQYDIFLFNNNLQDAVDTMTKAAQKALKGELSASFGLKRDGSFLYFASKAAAPQRFDDKPALERMTDTRTDGNQEGRIDFILAGKEYFGVYKYIQKWDVFLVRAEETAEFYSTTTTVFFRVSIIILVMTLVCIGFGIFALRYILRFMDRITQSLMKMQEDQKLELIDLSEAPNDDVTYLGASFNALSSSINNLMVIFRRFVTKDVAIKAYRDHEIKLEGTQKELAILFSDIKGFTYMTETLGNDIINLLNLHYDRAIRHIHNEDGIVGSIIGDALLAVYGTMDSGANKSLQAVRSAYRIQDVALDLRKEMNGKKEEIVRRRGALTEAEERVYKAILLEVGVGIDGGQVFYGNIGSYERMTNTVIGDNVNSSSRLEGLTRVYHVPVIVSDFIRNEIESSSREYFFLELDIVQVKGKTEGKKIFWPVQNSLMDDALEKELEFFSSGLKAYYSGDWKSAAKAWSGCTIPLVSVFKERIESGTCPDGWNGIWTMTTK